MEIAKANVAARRRLRLRRVVAVVLLLLILAAVIAALLIFRTFRGEITASNSHVTAPTKHALVPSRSFLSHSQVILVTFQNESLFVRTDPGQRLISILSTPSSASAPTEGGSHQTIAQVYAVAGTAGVIRFARSAFGLLTNHVALIEPTQIAPLVDAIGGIHISDRAYALSIGHAGGGGELYLRGQAARRYLESTGPPGSTVRSERERILLEAVVNRVMDVSAFSELRRLAHTFSSTVATDLSPSDTVALALLRLRIRNLVECGTAERSSLASSQSKQVLGQFLGRLPARAGGTRAVPRSGCHITGVSAAGVPAALISIGDAAVGVLPFLPAIGTFVIALDLFMLLMLLGAPRLLSTAGAGIGRVRRGRARRPILGVDEPLGRQSPAERVDEDEAREVPPRTALAGGEAKPGAFPQTKRRPIRFARDRAFALDARVRSPHHRSLGTPRRTSIAARLTLLRERVSEGVRTPPRILQGRYHGLAYGARVGLHIRYRLFSGPLRWAVAAGGLGLLIGYLVSGRF